MTMTRLNPWPAVVVGLAAAILAVVGCYPGDSASRTSKPVTASVPQPEPPGSKLFANWPKPAGALFITGEQIGYLSPCGCTQGQKGGLIRRMILVEQLRKQGWPLVPIDL